MNLTYLAPVLCSSSPPDEWRTNHLNFSERYELNYIFAGVMDSGCIALHHIANSDSCVFSPWVGANPIFRITYRYMRPTREYPRQDICIELEQRAGSGDDQEDQATVWDCARIFSGINSALHARVPARTSRTNAHECSYLARPRAESLSTPSMLPCPIARVSAWLASEVFPDGYWQGKRVLELGAGTGLCGLVMARLGASVTLTDMPGLVSLLESNVSRNGLEHQCRVRPLEWGRHHTPAVQEWFEPPYDAVIATDVAYALNAQAALVCTLAAASDTKTAVYIGHEHRWRDIDAWFLEELDVAFSVACVPSEEFPVAFRSPDTSIYTLTLKDRADSHEVEDSYF